MMFECCAHRFVDLSEPGCGLSILNDGQYGHACRDGMLTMSLLRSPNHPDPNADRGVHEFSYALLPHGGDWRAASVDRWAELLNTPLSVVGTGRPSAQADAFAPVSIESIGAGSVEVSALKPAEDGSGRVVLRIVETRGGRCRVRVNWNVPVGSVVRVDALERTVPEAAGQTCSHADGVSEIEVSRFGIVTLLAALA